jgi:hypothetical protein
MGARDQEEVQSKLVLQLDEKLYRRLVSELQR